MKNIPATVGIVTELEEKGCQQAADIAFRSIFEIKVVVCDQCWTGPSRVLDVLNNSRAYQKYKYPITEADEKPRTTECFFQHPLQKSGNGSSREGRKG